MAHKACTRCGGALAGRAGPLCAGCLLEAALGGADEALPVIEQYRVDALLGEGAMGAVYHAEQLAPIRRTVAIKLLKAGADSRQVLRRFEAERDLLARLDHPHIARVFDAGASADGRPFFALEYVDGEALTSFCEGRKLGVEARLRLMLDVLDAVQHAHQRGIIHRDLKPSNLLVTREGVVKVIDFGIAKATTEAWSEGSLRTQAGAVLGTLEYMAPEQAAGQTYDVDVRADVYSLGAVLYELLTDVRPLERAAGETLLTTLRRIQEEEPRTPSLVRPVAPELDWVAMKALDKDPERRYASAREFAVDLRAYLAGEPVAAAPASRSYRARKWVRRNKALTLAGVAALVAIVGGSAVSLWQAAEARRALRAAQANRLATLSVSRGEQDPELALLLGLHAVGETRRAGEEPTPAALSALHRAILSPPPVAAWRPHGNANVTNVVFGADGRTLYTAGQNEAAQLEGATGRRLRAFTAGGGGYAFGLAVSRDGRWVALGRDDRRAYLFDAATGRMVHVFEGFAHYVRAVAFSPDSGRLAVAAVEGTVQVWAMPELKKVAEWNQGTAVWRMTFSPDGRFLLTSGTRGGARLRELAGGGAGREVRRFLHDDAAVPSVAWSADGRWIATGSADTTIKLWDAATGEWRKTLHGHRDSIEDVVFSADSRQLLSSSDDKTARVWDVEGGRLVRVLAGHGAPLYKAAFDPGGERIVTVSNDGLARVWENRAAPEMIALEGHRVPLLRARFDPAGRRVAASGNEVTRVWEVNGKAVLTQEDEAHAGAMAWDGSGEILLTSALMPGGVIRLREVATGRTLSETAATGTRCHALAMSPDGRWLALGQLNGEVVIWKRSEGQRPAARFAAMQDGVVVVAFAPDSRRLLAGGASVWLAELGESGWKPVGELKGHTDEVWTARFSPDGARLATGSYDETVRVWDVASRQVRRVMRGHAGGVFGVAWSADGRRLASGGEDLLSHVWDPESGTELLALGGQKQSIRDVVFSGDGRELLSVAGDGVVVRHPLRLEDLLRAARGRLHRGLTEGECVVFFASAVCPALP